MKIEGNAKVNLIRLYNLFKNKKLTEKEFELCCRCWGTSPKKVEEVLETS